ncbi:MAG: HAD family hydrolase [Deltaproteobacteria bacterium]|nr:MAG: HAD family hydrolase [Deltaproteobacteria bacterium]
MTIAGVIFDCDGVLFESRRANLAYYNAILARFDLPPVTEDQPDKAQLCHTADSRTVLTSLLEPGLAERALEIAAGLDYRQFLPFMDPEPGMIEGLRRLSSAWPLAVATNRGNSMTDILHHFGLAECFSAVVTSRDVARPKPAPDMLFKAAQSLEIDSSQLVFVGDSELDRQAADAAGIRFVAYGERVSGDWQVRSHGELEQLLALVSSDP